MAVSYPSHNTHIMCDVKTTVLTAAKPKSWCHSNACHIHSSKKTWDQWTSMKNKFTGIVRHTRWGKNRSGDESSLNTVDSFRHAGIRSCGIRIWACSDDSPWQREHVYLVAQPTIPANRSSSWVRYIINLKRQVWNVHDNCNWGTSKITSKRVLSNIRRRENIILAYIDSSAS